MDLIVSGHTSDEIASVFTVKNVISILAHYEIIAFPSVNDIISVSGKYLVTTIASKNYIVA
jgi:hypothetical protein